MATFPHTLSHSARRVITSESDCAERALWLAVVGLAIRDGLLEPWANGGGDQERDPAPGSGGWSRCSCGGRCYQLVASWAGLSPAAVVELARREWWKV